MDLKCPFSAPLTIGKAACRHAIAVVRRGGTEHDCDTEASNCQCTKIYGRLKSVGLAAFGVDDDLTRMPHSVLVKIQCGGLSGLQRLLGGGPADVEDVATMINRVVERFDELETIPISDIADDMTGYRLERRAQRRR